MVDIFGLVVRDFGCHADGPEFKPWQVSMFFLIFVSILFVYLIRMIIHKNLLHQFWLPGGKEV